MPVAPKKWKTKIGTKAEAGDVKEVKHFTNGHKSFTTSEARAMMEQQTRENKTAANFEASKATLVRPRNPLTGEETPRAGGEMGAGMRRVEGVPLIPANQARPTTPPASNMWSRRNRPKDVSLKVGAFEEEDARKLHDLFPLPPRTSPETARELKRIEAMRVLQETMGGELAFLTSKLAGRTDKISNSLVKNMIDTRGK